LYNVVVRNCGQGFRLAPWKHGFGAYPSGRLMLRGAGFVNRLLRACRLACGNRSHAAHESFTSGIVLISMLGHF